MLRSSTKLLPRATLSPLLCLNTQLNVFSWGEFSGTRRNVISYRNQGFSSLPYLDSGQHEINPKLQRRGISSDSNGTNEGKIPKGNNNYSTFHSLKNMHYLSKQALEEVGLKHMTEIQSRTWEPIIDGKDVFGRVSPCDAESYFTGFYVTLICQIWFSHFITVFQYFCLARPIQEPERLSRSSFRRWNEPSKVPSFQERLAF